MNLTNRAKAQAEELLEELRKSTTVEAAQAKQLIGFLYEDAKERLVTSSDADTLRVQGEAQMLWRLYRKLTNKSPVTGE